MISVTVCRVVSVREPDVSASLDMARECCVTSIRMSHSLVISTERSERRDWAIEGGLVRCATGCLDWAAFHSGNILRRQILMAHKFYFREKFIVFSISRKGYGRDTTEAPRLP